MYKSSLTVIARALERNGKNIKVTINLKKYLEIHTDITQLYVKLVDATMRKEKANLHLVMYPTHGGVYRDQLTYYTRRCLDINREITDLENKLIQVVSVIGNGSIKTLEDI